MIRNGRFQDWTRDLHPTTTPRLWLAALGVVLFTGFLLAGIVFTQGLGSPPQPVEARRTVPTISTLRPTAFARTAIAVAPRAGTVSSGVASTGASEVPFGILVNSTNLRSEPDTTLDNITGLLMLGDEVEMVGKDGPSDPFWYHVRVRTTAGRLAKGTEGWVLASLVMVGTTETRVAAE